MLELFGWNLGIGAWAGLLLVLGALAFAILMQSVGELVAGYEWRLTALAALVGGWVGSEALGAASSWGPEWDGMRVAPAIIGAMVLGGLVELVARLATGGSFVHHHRGI
jgi:hypothetical protein